MPKTVRERPARPAMVAQADAAVRPVRLSAVCSTFLVLILLSAIAGASAPLPLWVRRHLVGCG